MINITHVALRRFALTSVAAIAVGCSGGGGGGSAPSVPATQPPSGTPPQAATVQVQVTVQKSLGTTSSSSRHPDYVSPSTQGLIVSVNDANGTHAQGYTLAANATGCTTLAGGQLQCVFPVTAASGSDTFYAYTYDAGQGASGNPTSLANNFTPSGKLLSETVSAGIAQTITAGTTNTVVLTLGPVVATVAFGQPTPPAVLSVSGNGGTTSQAVTFDGFDAAGNRFKPYVSSTPAGTYINPISITVSDGSANLTAPSPAALVNATVDSVYATFSSNNTSVQPTSATAAPYFATLTAGDSFGPGGFNNSTTYPQATAPPVTVAPLFLYSPAYSTAQGGTTTLYAIAAAKPPNAAYSIATAAPLAGVNDCSAFSTSTSNATLTNSQVAAFTISATGTSPSSNGSSIPCVFQVSDLTGTVTNSLGFISNGQTVIIVRPTPVPTGPPGSTTVVIPSPQPSPTH